MSLPAPSPELLESTGRFQVLAQLGQGGTGVVYRVHDRERQENVALKTLQLPSPSAIYQLKREFRALADVAHENLVTLHELLCIGEQWCLTMELVDGVDFLTYVCDARRAPFAAQTTRVSGPSRNEPELSQTASPDRGGATADMRLLRDSLTQLVQAVCALHASGRLHLDLKPMNVLIEPHGRLVVLDFGLVRELDGRAAQPEAFGTPAYMAPEQVGRDTPTEAADWYAVGAMMYEALTGFPPFVGPSTQLLLSKLSIDPPAPHQVRHGVPRDASDACMALLHRDHNQRGGAQELMRWLGRSDPLDPSFRSGPSPTPFVGRSDALARLAAAHGELRGGPVTVLVHGESGIGKTALVQEFLRGLPPEGVVLLEGRCLERESVPFKALDSIIDALGRYLAQLPPSEVAALAPRHVDALLRVFPSLERVTALAEQAARRRRETSVQDERDQGFMGLKSLLARIAERSRLIVFIDDLQWGDRDSALLVKELLTPPAPRLLLLGTYRSEERASSAFLRAFFSDWVSLSLRAHVHELQLLPLPDADTRQLIESLLAQEGADLRLAPGLATESEGNPFFAGELARSVAALSQQEGVSEPRALSLERVLRDRVAQLPDAERVLLEAVTVIGRPFEKELALKLADLGALGQRALDRLRSKRLLRTRGVRDLDLVEPYHDRIREVIGQAVAPQRRTSLHRKLAGELESRRRDDAEVLMLHYAEAGEPRKAAFYAAQAAELAHQTLAFDHAAILLRRSLELWPPEDPAEHTRLHTSLGQALERAGLSNEAAGAYLRAAELAQPQHVMNLHRMAAEQLLVCGHYARGIELLRATLPAFGLELARSSGRALASLLFRRSVLSLRGWSFVAREERAVDPQLLGRVDAAYAVSNGLGMLDSLVAADVQTKGVLLALEAGEPSRVVRAMCFESAFRCANTGGQAKTRAIVTRAQVLAEQVKRPEARGLVEMAEGFFQHHGEGNLPLARGPYERGEELLLGVPGMNGELMTLRCNLLTLFDWLGDVNALVQRMPALAQQADRRGDHFLATGILSAALFWLARDRAGELTEQARRCRELWPKDAFVMPYYWLLVAEAQRDVYLGDGRACVERVAEAWQDLSRSYYLSIPTVRIEVRYPRARAALLLGARGENRTAMLELAREDARVLERTRRGYALGLAALLRAGLAAAHDDRDEVPALLQTAVQRCSAQGLALHAYAAELRLGSVLGGETGREQVQRAAAGMRKHGVKNVEKLMRALAPGFDRD